MAPQIALVEAGQISPITDRTDIADGPVCLECGELLDLIQPDPQIPDRLVGQCTASDCGRSYSVTREPARHQAERTAVGWTKCSIIAI